jgi:FixJ family two-component response regulator
MPEMSGRELVDALHTDRPGLRVLYMSGYTDDEILRRGLKDPGMSFIQKPFTAENLAMQVRKVLDAA